MSFSPEERIALFIDGTNLYATSRALGFDIDYRKLRTYFNDKCYVLRALYYTTLADDQEYSSIRPLVDWLDYNGYSVVTKPSKEFTDSSGRRKFRGSMDVELCIDAIDLTPHVDHIVLFTGDGDFHALVQAIQRRGRKVTVVSTISTSPVMVADDLRRQADHFLDLASLKTAVGRDPSERPPRPARSDDEDDEDFD